MDAYGWLIGWLDWAFTNERMDIVEILHDMAGERNYQFHLLWTRNGA